MLRSLAVLWVASVAIGQLSCKDRGLPSEDGWTGGTRGETAAETPKDTTASDGRGVGLTCGEPGSLTTCSAGQVCCYFCLDGDTPPPSCRPDCTGGSGESCDGPEDCPAGMVCCDEGLTTCSGSVSCRKQPCSGPIKCHADADCPGDRGKCCRDSARWGHSRSSCAPKC